MRTIRLENGKEVKISEESYKALAKENKEDYKIDNNTSLVDSYKLVCALKEDQERIKTTEKKNRQIYVNQIFANKSIFGNKCVFIKCKFGSDCEFSSFCKFGSGCEFSSGCKKQTPYWNEDGKQG